MAKSIDFYVDKILNTKNFDMSELDFTDSDILQELGLKPVQDFTNDPESYLNAKKQYFKFVIMGAAIDSQRGQAFTQLKSISVNR